ncbi:MAG: TonB-dependent receptor [Acidobacteria bacterium]|nr:TonB-dependent receptor [Acidobacteriota bacterium]
MRSLPAACALLFALTASAQSSGAEKPELSETIVVTAQREPQAIGDAVATVSIMEEDELSQRPVADLAELIDGFPGTLTLLSAPGGGRPMVVSRGFFGGGEVEYFQLVVNGFPVGDVETGLVPLTLYPASVLEKLELLRTAGSSVWGDVAMGGMIDVTTRRPTEIDASLTLGSEGLFRVEGLLPIAEGGSLILAGSHAEGARRNAGEENLLVDANYPIFESWRAQIAVSSVSFEDPGPVRIDQAASDPDASNELFTDDSSTTLRIMAGITGAHDDIDGSLWIAFRRLDQTRTLLFAPELGLTADRDLEAGMIGVRAQSHRALELAGKTAIFRGGLEASSRALDQTWRDRATSTSGRSSGSRVAAGVWLVGTVPLSTRIDLEGGLRWDSIRDRFDSRSAEDEELSPRIGLNLDISGDGNVTARLLWARAFKAPAVEQRFDPRPLPGFDGTTFTISNELLRPQRATLVEGGVRVERGPAAFDLALYEMDVTDEIDFDSATFRYENLAATRHRGAELEITGSTGAVRHRVSYTWMEVEPVAPARASTQLKNIPEHHADLFASVPVGRVEASIGVHWIGERFLDDANLFRLEPVTTVDLRAATSWGSWTGWIDLANITDQRYPEVGFILRSLIDGREIAEVYPSGGRSLRMGLSRTFGSSARGGRD